MRGLAVIVLQTRSSRHARCWFARRSNRSDISRPRGGAKGRGALRSHSRRIAQRVAAALSDPAATAQPRPARSRHRLPDQELRYGGLSKATIRRARTGAWLKFGNRHAGARLVREWNGRTHTVTVEDEGFSYAGRDYRSLSAIAREITGARWSGPRFFGLAIKKGASDA